MYNLQNIRYELCDNNVCIVLPRPAIIIIIINQESHCRIHEFMKIGSFALTICIGKGILFLN